MAEMKTDLNMKSLFTNCFTFDFCFKYASTEAYLKQKSKVKQIVKRDFMLQQGIIGRNEDRPKHGTLFTICFTFDFCFKYASTVTVEAYRK